MTKEKAKNIFLNPRKDKKKEAESLTPKEDLYEVFKVDSKEARFKKGTVLMNGKPIACILTHPFYNEIKTMETKQSNDHKKKICNNECPFFVKEFGGFTFQCTKENITIPKERVLDFDKYELPALMIGENNIKNKIKQ